MELLEFYMKQTGKKLNEITPQEYDALKISCEFFREFSKKDKQEVKIKL